MFSCSQFIWNSNTESVEKMNNILHFINKLSKYNFKEINIEDDYDYYVHMNNR